MFGRLLGTLKQSWLKSGLHHSVARFLGPIISDNEKDSIRTPVSSIGTVSRCVTQELRVANSAEMSTLWVRHASWRRAGSLDIPSLSSGKIGKGSGLKSMDEEHGPEANEAADESPQKG